jgi:F-type H+-transporting ATPase subunit a
VFVREFALAAFLPLMSFSFPIAAAIPLYADKFFLEADWLTNSILVSLLVMAIVLLFARRATKDVKLVPDGPQNRFEAIVETLYDTVEEIVGPHMVSKAFSLLATLFIFILVSNWFALLPGVGSIGFAADSSQVGAWHSISAGDLKVPILRPTTADLNMTLAMALVFMALWLYWSIGEMGVGGFLKHMFGVKGGRKGFMAIVLVPIFFMVGVIEVVSIAFRPVSLSLRLFGNVFAGENLLVTMLTLGKQLGLPDFIAYLSSIILPIPFYFLELLIGLLQAMVFTLLCAVYITLSTTHDEEEGH